MDQALFSRSPLGTLIPAHSNSLRPPRRMMPHAREIERIEGHPGRAAFAGAPVKWTSTQVKFHAGAFKRFSTADRSDEMAMKPSEAADLTRCGRSASASASEFSWATKAQRSPGGLSSRPIGRSRKLADFRNQNVTFQRLLTVGEIRQLKQSAGQRDCADTDPKLSSFLHPVLSVKLTPYSADFPMGNAVLTTTCALLLTLPGVRRPRTHWALISALRAGHGPPRCWRSRPATLAPSMPTGACGWTTPVMSC